MQAHVCTSVKRSEVNIRRWCLPLLPISFRDGVSLGTELTVSASQTGQSAPEICLSLLSQSWNYRHIPYRAWLLHGCWGFELRS